MEPTLLLYTAVATVIVLWIVSLAIMFYKLMIRYPLATTWREDENPYKSETLGMPPGVIRSILTLSLLFAVLLLEAVNIIFPGTEEKAPELMTAFQMALAFYFGSRVMNTVSDAEVKKTQAATLDEDKAVG